MANRLRGEMEISLGGRQLLLRPSFDRLVEIEDLSGQSVIGLMTKIGRKGLGVKDMAAIVYGGAVDREGMTLESVGQALLDDGLAKHLLPICKFISQAMTPNAQEQSEESQEKKDQAAG